MLLVTPDIHATEASSRRCDDGHGRREQYAASRRYRCGGRNAHCSRARRARAGGLRLFGGAPCGDRRGAEAGRITSFIPIRRESPAVWSKGVSCTTVLYWKTKRKRSICTHFPRRRAAAPDNNDTGARPCCAPFSWRYQHGENLQRMRAMSRSKQLTFPCFPGACPFAGSRKSTGFPWALYTGTSSTYRPK